MATSNTSTAIIQSPTNNDNETDTTPRQQEEQIYVFNPKGITNRPQRRGLLIDFSKIKVSHNVKSDIWEDVCTFFHPINEAWKDFFILASTELYAIMEYLTKNSTYLPFRSEVFSVFNLIAPHDIRLVIFGQDPYPQILPNGKPKAVGIAFSIRPDDYQTPQSLINVFTAIRHLYPNTVHRTGDLTSWVQQGVFLINKCLTVFPGAAGSHGQTWTGFIIKLIRYISELKSDIHYFLWGKHAEELGKYIKTKGMVLRGPHPVARGKVTFSGCTHFFDVNQHFISNKEEQINWGT